MTQLSQLYSINEENLALRRDFVQLGPRDIATLRRLSGWGDRTAAKIAHAFYEHQFGHPASRSFFERYAAAKGIQIGALREGLERAQAGYFKEIFAEAAESGRYGAAYFERRFAVGALHNKINLPLKWYLGSYVTYFDLVRSSLRSHYRHRPVFRAHAERALTAVFNLDMQAVVEAFYYDTFATIGLDLSLVPVTERAQDLSDHGAELKLRVSSALRSACHAATTLRQASREIATTTEETGRAVGEIAQAMEDVAQGSERQSVMVESVSRTVEDVSAAVSDTASAAEQTASAAGQARDVARDGAAIAAQASEAMVVVRDNATGAASAIRALAGKSEQIGAIVVTIAGIAEQTNLLALNAAIEAARAGDQGRGFAVVAEEVRGLAESSHQASNQIATLIAEIQAETQRAVSIVEAGAKGTEDGVSTVSRAGEAFSTIGDAVEDIAGRVDQIAAMAEQITASSVTMRESMIEVASVSEAASAASQQVSASTQQTSASSEQTAASAIELSRMADELSSSLSAFNLTAG
jgi:methyl-accepting chemotaxis protein